MRKVVIRLKDSVYCNNTIMYIQQELLRLGYNISSYDLATKQPIVIYKGQKPIYHINKISKAVNPDILTVRQGV